MSQMNQTTIDFLTEKMIESGNENGFETIGELAEFCNQFNGIEVYVNQPYNAPEFHMLGIIKQFTQYNDANKIIVDSLVLAMNTGSTPDQFFTNVSAKEFAETNGFEDDIDFVKELFDNKDQFFN